MKRLLLGSALALVAMTSGCKRDDNPTPDGTSLLDWTHPPKTGMSDVTLGKDVGEGTTITKTIVIQPKQGGLLDARFGEVRLSFEMTHGPVELAGAESRKQVAAPRSVKVVLLHNDHWRVEAECDDAMSVPMGSIDKESGHMLVPDALFQHCRVVLKRGDYDTRSLSLEMFGDGRIEHSMAFDEVRFEDS